MSWSEHVITLPVLLPLLLGALLILIDERKHRVKFWLNFAGVLALLGVAIQLLLTIDAQQQALVLNYQAAGWAAPFGISLVADRLAAMMLVLVALMP